MTMVNEDKQDKERDKDSGSFLKGKIFGQGEIKFRNGNTYKGMLKGSLRHGYGKMVYETPVFNGDGYDIGEYFGEWKRDKRHGRGTMVNNGNKFIGHWKNDKIYTGEYIGIDGTTYKGRFKNGSFHGPGTLTFSSGKVVTGIFDGGDLPKRAKIQFTNGDVFDGFASDSGEPGKEGTMTYPNGDVYIGGFVDGHRHGHGSFLFENGSKYEGRWQQGKRMGQGKQYTRFNGEYFEGMFINDRKEGEGKLILPNGDVYDGVWYGDKLQKPKKPNGRITKVEYQGYIERLMKEKGVSEPHVKIIL